MLLLMEFKLVPICPQLQAIQSLCTSLISIQQMSRSGICTVIWSLYCHPHFTDEEKSKDVNFFSKVKTKQISDPNTILCSNWKNLLIWKDVDDKCDNSQIIHNKQ